MLLLIIFIIFAFIGLFMLYTAIKPENKLVGGYIFLASFLALLLNLGRVGLIR